MTKILPIIVIVIVAVGILTGLSKQIISALDSSKRFDQNAEAVTKLADENKSLKHQLEMAESDESLEKIMREELNLAKPGETIVVIQKDAIEEVINSQKPPVPTPKPANWEGWMRLFTN